MDGPASILWTVAAILTAALAARFWTPASLTDRLSNAMSLSWAPVIAGAISSLVIAWVWGSLHQIPILHDGVAYLTQARILSTFHLYAGSRPLPEFFEQYHMFVTPKFMAKYPPGHSLLLVPGVWIGLPSLVPILLAGVTGGFSFALARRLANTWVALITWMLWTTAPGVLSFFPSYLSQTTTSALWLVGWWALLRWRQHGRRRYLLLLATCIAWGMLTHPFTWLLFAIPAGVVVLVRAQRRAWKDLALAIGIGCVSLAVLFAWSETTMGAGVETPWSVYADTYFPWDRLGFAKVTTPPLRSLPPDMVRFAEAHSAFPAKHTIAALPSDLVTRLAAMFADQWGDWRRMLAPFALVSLIGVSPELGFALVSTGFVFCGFLLYGYDPSWTAYYVELYPVLAYATALGLWRFMGPIRDPRMTLREMAKRRFSPHSNTAMLVVGVMLLPPCFASVWSTRRGPFMPLHPIERFKTESSALAGKKIIVFVKYSATHPVDWSLVTNDADLAKARMWAVHDRGPDDVRLIRLAPARVAYRFDEATNTFTRLDTTSLAAAATETAARAAPVCVTDKRR